MKRRVLHFIFVGGLISICVACQHQSSHMIGDLRGGSLPDAARNHLKSLGFDSGWAQKIEANSKDNRPRHDFIEMKGPFSDLGISGWLELTFYNDRLMDAQFIPNESERYFRLLSQHLGKLPEIPGKTQKIGPEVTVRYYRDADGSIRFYWEYLPVSKEWQDWVARYSFVFLAQLNRNS